MGVTISHTNLAPISMASSVIGFVSFGFTLATFFNVFWSSLVTIKNAPSEISDYLASLKQGLLEERRHLRRVRRRLARKRPNNLDGSRGASGSKRRSSGAEGRSRSRGRPKQHGAPYFERDMQAFRSEGENSALRTQKIAVRDMIRRFRSIESLFLRLELQNQTSAQWSATPAYLKAYPIPEKGHFSSHDEDEYYDESDSPRFGSEYRACGLRERWLWLWRKDDIISLSEGLSRVETRRTAHEVTELLMAIGDIGRDLEDVREVVFGMEGRLGRVVGIRRVD